MKPLTVSYSQVRQVAVELAQRMLFVCQGRPVRLYPVSEGGAHIAYLCAGMNAMFEVTHDPAEANFAILDVRDAHTEHRVLLQYGIHTYALWEVVPSRGVRFPWTEAD